MQSTKRALRGKKQALNPAHRHHEAWQHNTAARLEGVVKNRGTKPTRKPKQKKNFVALLYPAWLLRAQAALRGL